ncbi:unnamed protein product [Allacma fusca]|uniref:SH3 domain-containing protein n=1 Tax=Allacma fusca TaxID=39272 RepID=A0A8J2P9N7_9HEXA|nr:unnamed protein product [Allacma fusca]
MSKANGSTKTRAPFLDKTHQVIVNFNYVYTHKSKKIEITKGEVLQLLQKTNEHWWKCLRLGQPKSFYVPATYVSVLESQHSDSASTDDDLENDETQCDMKNDKLSQGMGRQPMMENVIKDNLMKEEDNQSLSSIPSNVVTFSNEQLASGSFSNNHSSSSVHIDKASSCGSISNLKKAPYWSSSLEELAKQIVFPGQSSIYFNNPSFKPDSGSNFKVTEVIIL